MPIPPPLLDAAELRAATFVRHVEIHDELGSTNDRARQLAPHADIELPALVITRRQSAGRGRGRKTWWSPDGALVFSLLLDATDAGIRPVNWPRLSLTAAVAVCDALSHALNLGRKQAGVSPPPATLKDEPARANWLSRVGIKWPNDVLLDGRKVCGILIESPGGRAPTKDRLVLGIGINVNNSFRSAPGGLDRHGIALCDRTGRKHELQDVLTAVLNAIAARLGQLRESDPQLVCDWQQLDLVAGKQVTVEADGRHFEGGCVEVADDGALVVNTTSGRRRFLSGSIRTRGRQ